MEDKDFDLTDYVYIAITKKIVRGDMSLLSLEEQTIGLVWDAMGIIGNGGFAYYLAGELSWTEAPAAFDAIGVPEVADAIRTILRLYADETPPTQDDERNAILAKFRARNPQEYDRLNNVVWAAKTRIVAKSGAYIRRHPKLLALVDKV